MKKDEQSRLYSFFAAESDRLKRYVHARVYRINDMDAEDMVREVMMGMLLRDERGGSVENLAAYTYRAVRNKIADYHSEQARTVSLDGYTDEDKAFSLREMLPDDTQDVIAGVEQKELLRALSAGINQLEAKQRAVLIATEFYGKSFRELSEEWHEPMGTLLSRKCRAVKALREMMKDPSKEPKEE